MQEQKNYSKQDMVTGRNTIFQSIIDLVPKNLRLLINPQRKYIETFVQKAAKELDITKLLLDAGSGPSPYRHYFRCKYEATEIYSAPNIDFVCSLINIPKKENTYDAILNTEVLEHVPDPDNVIKEMYRVLKKGGKLFMTAPQMYCIHQEPYNFYYFTEYALLKMLTKAGFNVDDITIKPRGGYFIALVTMIRENGILDQIKHKKYIYWPLRIIEYPINCIIIPILGSLLDWIDTKKKWTIGYTVEAKK